MADDDDDSQGGAGSDDSSQGDAADGAVASPASPAAPRPAAGAAASPASPAAPRPGAGSAFDSEEDDDLAADTEDEEDNPALTDSDGDGDAPPPAADAPLQTADDDDGAAQLVDAAAGWDAAADAREAGLPQRRITVVKRRTAPAPSRHEAEDYGDSTTAWSAYSRAITSMADGDAESARRTLAALAEKGHLQGDPSVLLRLAQVQLLQALDLWPEKQIAAAKKAEALLEKAAAAAQEVEVLGDHDEILRLIRLELAVLAMDRGDYAQAVDLCELGDFDDEAESGLILAEMHLRNSNEAAASEEARRAVATVRRKAKGPRAGDATANLEWAFEPAAPFEAVTRRGTRSNTPMA